MSIGCQNKVSYWIPKGWDYKEAFVKCGNTDIHGNRAICDECLADAHKMETINRQERLASEDNATARAAGWGEF